MVDFRVGDNKDLIQELEGESVSLSCTSPPYKNEDNFLEIDFSFLFSELYRVHKKDSLFFLNFGHLANFKERPFLVMLEALKTGWKLNETFMWLKTQYSPIQGKKRVNNLTEFIFLLYKGSMPDIDRLAVGTTYKDKSNIKRGYASQDLKCSGNLWTIPYETIQKKEDRWHKDIFPLELPRRAIKLSGLKEGVVLDIFVGSGSTLLAAQEAGLDAIGFEKDEKYKEIFEKRKGFLE